MNFGQRLKDLRLQAGLTQQQLAWQIGTSKSVISFYENQERTPSPTVLIQLASVFHVSADMCFVPKVLGVALLKKLKIYRIIVTFVIALSGYMCYNKSWEISIFSILPKKQEVCEKNVNFARGGLTK